MSLADKWIEKSLKTFNSGDNDYKSIKEFNNGLLRAIELREFQNIEFYFIKLIPIIEKRALFHELEQIVENYLKHLTKHKALIHGFIPLIDTFSSFSQENSCPDSNSHLISVLLEFLSTVSDQSLNDNLIKNYKTIIEKAVGYEFFENLLFLLFKTLIRINQFDHANNISNPTFFDSIGSETQLQYAMYATLVLAYINLPEAKDKLQYFRKTIKKEFQQKDIFKYCSETILSISSKDLDFFSELKNYYSSQLQNRILNLLSNQLQQKYFPKKKEGSILDLFKK